jgi:outer membrane protein OmpA-like peptidoglycan-associated protein
MKKIFCLIFVLLFSFASYSQQDNDKANKRMNKALEYFQEQKEDKAIECLNDIINDYPSFAPAYVALGEVFYSKKDFDKSISYYEKSISIDSSFDLNSFYRLALMQKEKKLYKQSKANFSYYVNNQKKERYKERVEDCKQEIENIDFIINNIDNPVPFTPKNLGSNVNDTTDEYLATLTCDENLFLTVRKDDKEDFYICNKIKDKTNDDLPLWDKRQELPYPLNSENNEGAGAISPDGKTIYFAKCNSKDGFGSCDIYSSERVGDKWSEPKNLGENVNSNAWDSQPTIASDNRTLFFVSNRSGGFGQSDIYFTYKQNDGSWSKAKNLGSTINTKGKEMSPFIHPSNTTLYFSSDYLTGMGKMDIFYSRIENGKLTKPVNLGYPINTENDETSFTVAPNGKYAIYASNREDSYGKLDLYAFPLYEKARPTPVICMKGKVIYDNNKKDNISLLEIKDLSTGKVITSTSSDRINDTYLMTLPIGKDYAMSVTCKGYLFYSENFSLSNDTNLNMIEKDINLVSIKEGNKIILKNIFFATNSFALLPQSNAELETLLDMMTNNPTIKIEISGYTDNVGKDDYNINLSQKRAESVKQYLINKGVKEDRIVAKGYGKNNPIATNDNEQGRQMNRRTEFKVIKQ